MVEKISGGRDVKGEGLSRGVSSAFIVASYNKSNCLLSMRSR